MRSRGDKMAPGPLCDPEDTIELHAVDLVGALELRGVVARIFGGVAVRWHTRILTCLPLRKCADIDIVVHREHWNSACTVLSDLDWVRPTYPESRSYPNHLRFYQRRSGLNLDVTSSYGPLRLPVQFQGGLEASPGFLSPISLFLSLAQTPDLTTQRMMDLATVSLVINPTARFWRSLQLIKVCHPFWWFRFNKNLTHVRDELNGLLPDGERQRADNFLRRAMSFW